MDTEPLIDAGHQPTPRLRKILDEHATWVRGSGGARAYLGGADLRAMEQA